MPARLAFARDGGQAPGALHHIICKCIERQNIFKNNTDRNRFPERLDSVLQKTSTHCYGWALIPNHLHLLLKTGKEPIVQIMRRLLTGYAVIFKRRYRRYGRWQIPWAEQIRSQFYTKSDLISHISLTSISSSASVGS